jgi:hypothetical protein
MEHDAIRFDRDSAGLAELVVVKGVTCVETQAWPVVSTRR